MRPTQSFNFVGAAMLSFNDPEDELIFALFLPCGTLIVAALAVVIVPVLACLYVGRLLKRVGHMLLATAQNVTALAVPESRGDRVVF